MNSSSVSQTGSSTLSIPSGVNLSGVDLSQHDSTVRIIIRLNAALIATIAVIICVRIYARLSILRRIWADDALIIIAGLFTIGLSVTCIIGTRFGLGKHEWDLNLTTVIDSTKEIIKTLFICQVLYVTAVTLTKISIITSYMRVFPTLSLHRLMYVTAAIIIASWVCSVLVTIFQCNPVRGAWDFTLQRDCIPILKFFYFQSSLNIATDLVLCISPLPLCWSLSIRLQERIILCVLFGVGFFATAASIIRLTQLHDLGTIDISYTSVASLNWSVVEVCTGIICASVPSLKPIAMKYLPRTLFYVPSHRPRQRTPVIDLSYHSGTMINSDGLMLSHLQKNADVEEI